MGGASSFLAEPLLLVGTTGFEEDGEALEFSDFPEDFYVTDTYTEKMLSYLECSPEDQPWFAFMPYTAPHWPLQLPDDWLDRNAGEYGAGYDQLRVNRVAQATAKGVIQGSFKGREIQDYRDVSAWSLLTGESNIVHTDSYTG